VSQEDALARAWRAVADAPEDPDPYAALRRALPRHDIAPEEAFRRGLGELPLAPRPPEELVHRLAHACGLGYGDPRLRWDRKVRHLAARPDGGGALAEDDAGAALWVDTTSLCVWDLPHEPLEAEVPVTRGVLADGQPWMARRGRRPGSFHDEVLRVTRWDPATPGRPVTEDLELGLTIGEPTFVWGLPEGLRVLARVEAGMVYLLGPGVDRELPALARGFGRGWTGLPGSHLLGPARDDADAMRLTRLDASTGAVVDTGPVMNATDRFQVSSDGTRLALYQRDTRGASVRVLALPSWETEVHVPLVEGFLGWTPAGDLILGPSATGHLGRWCPGEASATRLSSPPPEAAARYALLRTEPAELLMLAGGRLRLHDLASAAQLGPPRGTRRLAAGRATVSVLDETRWDRWDVATGTPSHVQNLPAAVPWILDVGRIARELRPPTRGLLLHDEGGADLGPIDLAGQEALHVSGGDPLGILVRRHGGGAELQCHDRETGEIHRVPLRSDPSRLVGGGVWVPGELAWILTAAGPLWLETTANPAWLQEVTAVLGRRRLTNGTQPPGKPTHEEDLRFPLRVRRGDHPGQTNAPCRAPWSSLLWLPDAEETRALTPDLEVAHRLAHPPADCGPVAVSLRATRVARALPEMVLVYDVATGRVVGELPTRSLADDLAFLGEDELLVLHGDRIRSVPLPAS
jgi:hypothetical protein